MKVKKFILSHKVGVILSAVCLLFVLVAAGFWLYQSRDRFFGAKTVTSANSNTTDSSVQDNLNSKENSVQTQSGANSASNTTATVPSLEDVSLNATINVDSPETADVALYGPAATYRVDRLTQGSWQTIQSSFSYSGRGGYNIATVDSSTAVNHFKVYKLDGNTVIAQSGDTSITWEQIKSSGTISVPLAR